MPHPRPTLNKLRLQLLRYKAGHCSILGSNQEGGALSLELCIQWISTSYKVGENPSLSDLGNQRTEY